MFSLLLLSCFLFNSRVSLAQIECSSEAPVAPDCAAPLGNDWSSMLTADSISHTSVTLSWNADLRVSQHMTQMYELFYRMVPDTGSPGSWGKMDSPIIFNASISEPIPPSLSNNFGGLEHDTGYQMRVCLYPAPDLPQTGPASDDCGICTLCFETLDGSINVLSTRLEVHREGLTYVCEASANPAPSITWTGVFSGVRRQLLMNDTDYEISTMSNGDMVLSELILTMVEVDDPECILNNEFDSMTITMTDFQIIELTSPSTSTPSIILITATFRTVNDMVEYFCQALSSAHFSVDWYAFQNGRRERLVDDVTMPYTIITPEPSEVTGGSFVLSSMITYNPNLVDFTGVECEFESTDGGSRRIVRNDEFQNITNVISPTTPSPTQGPPTAEIEIWVIVLLAVLPAIVIGTMIIIMVTVLCIKRKKKKAKHAFKKQTGNESNDYMSSLPQNPTSGSSSETSMLYGSIESALPEHMIIPNTDIKVSTVVGQGEYGIVYRGTLVRNNHHQQVAVKTLKGIFSSPSDIQSFTEEILILHQFHHPNVMSLIGVCLGTEKGGSGPSIILPFMSKGSLLSFLRKQGESLKPLQNADISHIEAIEKSLVKICLQIAKGMEYLAGQRFVHRDLAARNCMIDQNDQIRVSDFGLSEDIYARNYFKQLTSDGVKLPVKWMAPESLKLGIFNEKSDVWSYGVTCWEVFSCGEIPYPGVHPQEVLHLLEYGQRLRKPKNPACSDTIYKIIQGCWNMNPGVRSNFSQLCSAIDSQLQYMSDYLDLNIIANSAVASEESTYSMAEDYGGFKVPQSDDAYDKVYEEEPEKI